MTATTHHGLPAAVAALAGRPGAQLRETHASWVVLVGDRAYKLKKPVRFAFLDQSTLALRRAACIAEVELNRELADGLYLGVRALVPDGGACGLRLAAPDAPGAVEYAVEMRRFDERATLAAGVRAGTAGAADVRAVAQRLAAFHGRARRVRAAAEPSAAAAAALGRIDRNAEELIALLPDTARRRRVAAQLRGMAAFVSIRAPQLSARAREGMVREVHGDVRAEHVLVGTPPTIVDRLEFSRELREIDVADEVAFLAMDLTALGAAGLAHRLLAAYRDAGGDAGDDRLVAFHATYRAHVRAKVALLRGRQDEACAQSARADANRLLVVAERFAWEMRLPRVLVVCGPSASGKSRLAAELSQRSGRPVLSSDVARKRLAGLAATERADAELYDEATNARTYARLGEEAGRRAVDEGVIVDATFRRRPDRATFAAALRVDAAEIAFVECRAPVAVLRDRARRRMQDPARVSDATPALALAQQAAFDALDEVDAERHHIVRTDRPPQRIADVLAAALDERPAPAP